KQHKINSADLFATGINDYREALFLSAQKSFMRVAALNSADTVAAHYRDSCTVAVTKGGGVTWDGAERIETK
ncbi:MAG TPA: hypothetical protein VMV65_04590, partial [Alphaproteobacteria bacterium]|nr:hypothetical protein [Alphaproteobacteria bacterium]